MVHYFKDRRATLPDAGAPGPCIVDGVTCKDGDRCNCLAADARCVASSAPANAAPTGAGQCRVQPQPVVRVFVKANPTPVAVIPLAPDAVTIGAPCQMLYVADVIWPQRQDGGIDAGAVRVIAQGADDAGLIANPLIRRYG